MAQSPTHCVAQSHTMCVAQSHTMCVAQSHTMRVAQSPRPCVAQSHTRYGPKFPTQSVTSLPHHVWPSLIQCVWPRLAHTPHTALITWGRELVRQFIVVDYTGRHQDTRPLRVSLTPAHNTQITHPHYAILSQPIIVVLAGFTKRVTYCHRSLRFCRDDNSVVIE